MNINLKLTGLLSKTPYVLLGRFVRFQSKKYKNCSLDVLFAKKISVALNVEVFWFTNAR